MLFERMWRLLFLVCWVCQQLRLQTQQCVSVEISEACTNAHSRWVTSRGRNRWCWRNACTSLRLPSPEPSGRSPSHNRSEEVRNPSESGERERERERREKARQRRERVLQQTDDLVVLFLFLPPVQSAGASMRASAPPLVGAAKCSREIAVLAACYDASPVDEERRL